MKSRLPSLAVRLIGLVLVTIVVSVGCGGGVTKTTINGTITYQGKPVRSGILKFVGPGTASSQAMIKPDGTFTITDVTPGEVKAFVTEGPPAPTKDAGPTAEPLPEKYRDPEKSGLKYTISPGMTSLDIDIK